MMITLLDNAHTCKICLITMYQTQSINTSAACMMITLLDNACTCKICLITMYQTQSINTSAACMMITLLDNARSGAKFLHACHIAVAVWYCMMIEYRQWSLCRLYHIVHLHSLPNGANFLHAMASHARSLHHSRLRDFTVGLLVVYTTSWHLS